MSDQPRRAAHDTGIPDNLLRFMVTGWATPPGTPAAPIEGIERFAARRAALGAAFPGETLVVPTGHEKTRANDTSYRFRPGTDFYYLTGNTEPDNILVLDVSANGEPAATLYCEPNPGKTECRARTSSHTPACRAIVHSARPSEPGDTDAGPSPYCG